MDNQTYIEKAVVTTDALSAAGKLNEAQANRFIDFVIDETGLKDSGVRIVRFRNEKWEVDKINVANRVAVALEEATDPGLRRGVSHSKVTLQPKDIMVPFEIGDIYKRHNIEGMSVEEHIIKMMATRCANNVEELWLDGNDDGPGVYEDDIVEGGSSTLVRKDSFLSLFDGLLKLAEAGHAYDAANATISPTVLSRAILQMPNKFRKRRDSLRHYISWNHQQRWLEGIATRATALGDASLGGLDAIKPFGIPWYPLSLLDPNPTYTEHIVLNGTTATSLTYAPVTDVLVMTSTLGKNLETPFILTTDYVLDATNGTVARSGGGSAIGDGDTVKVTYRTAGRSIITNPANIIIGFGLDITIERDRNIYTKMDEFAISLATSVQFEETDAVVLLSNVAVPS